MYMNIDNTMTANTGDNTDCRNGSNRKHVIILKWHQRFIIHSRSMSENISIFLAIIATSPPAPPT